MLSADSNEEHRLSPAESPIAADLRHTATPPSIPHEWAQALIENIESAVLIVDQDWRIVFANAQAYKTLERTPVMLLGQSLWDAFPHLTGSSFEIGYRQAMEQGIPSRLKDFYPSRQKWYDVRIAPTDLGLIIYFGDVTAQRHLEMSLQSSERRFRILSEASFEGIIIHHNGVVIDANQRAVELHGYATLEEFIGVPLRQIVDAASWSDVQRRIALGAETVYESFALRKDGRRILVESRGNWLEYRGQTMRIVALRDITDQRRAEAEIRQQAERTRIQAEVSRKLTEVTSDYQATLDTAAQELAQIIGDACAIRLISDDGIWMKLAASYHPDPDVAMFVRTLLSGEQYQRTDEGLTGRVIQTGEIVFIPVVSILALKASLEPKLWGYLDRFTLSSLMLVPLRAEGSVIGIITMARNQPDRPYTDDDQTLVRDLADRVALAITNARLFVQVQNELAERTKMEATLRASQAYFRALIENSPDAIALCAADGTIIYGSPATTRILGYELDAFVGHRIGEFIHPDDYAFASQQGAQLFQNPDVSVLIQARLRHQDGSWRYIEAMSTNMLGDPNVGAIVNNYRDNTERKRLEGQLLQVQKMDGIGRLAGGIAHDFNNLLTVISSYSELVLADMREDDHRYADIAEIQKASQRAEALTRQLLAFSRQKPLYSRPLNLNAVVADMDNLLHRLIGEDIVLVSMFTPDLDMILAEPSHIEQVILNLAINARDAMPEGGQLTFETANVELDAAYRLPGHPQVKTGAYVMLAVSDTGMGMDQATQEHMYEPFFTTKEVGQGTGLGLATVYGIVHQSGGSIWVYSELGIGTTFKIYFPQAAASATATPAQIQPPERTAEDRHVGRTILVVEDEALVRAFILRVLAQAGYTALEAENGQAALALLETYATQVDLIVTDIIMPQMGGRTLMSHLKTRWPHLKVVCMSGYTDQALSRQEAMFQFDAFLQKPFTPRILLQQVEKVL